MAINNPLLRKTQKHQEGGLSCPPVFLFPVAGVGKPPLPEYPRFSQGLAGVWPVGELPTSSCPIGIPLPALVPIGQVRADSLCKIATCPDEVYTGAPRVVF